MDPEEYNNDEPSFKRWLNFFCIECEKRQAAEDDTLPLIPPFTRFTDNETEAECLNWCLQLLTSRKCPNVLACHLARSVYLRMVSLDQSPFYKQNSNEGLTEIDSHRYMRMAYQKLYSICEEWREHLPPIHIQHALPLVSSHAIKNTRRKMEDRHVILSDVNALLGFQDAVDESFYGVFDGHAGVDAAIYASAHLSCNITRDENHGSDAHRALFNAHNLTDQRFVAKSKREALKSGTTCVTALIQGDQIHVSWLGDSQAILVRDGQAVILTSSHKPERLDEKQRIEELGGCVVWYGTWRVNGNIAVSRAIGDSGHKPYISSDPDTVTVTMDGTEEYMVLACDGAWDTLAKDDIPKIVYDHLKYNDGDLTTAARSIVVAARDNGSADNITVIVVFFKTVLSVPPGCVSRDDEVAVKDERRDSEQCDDYSPSRPFTPNFHDASRSDLGMMGGDMGVHDGAGLSDCSPCGCVVSAHRNAGGTGEGKSDEDGSATSGSGNNSLSEGRGGGKGHGDSNRVNDCCTTSSAVLSEGLARSDGGGSVVDRDGRQSVVLMGTDAQRSFYYGHSQYMPTFNKKSRNAQPHMLSVDFEDVLCGGNNKNKPRFGASKSAASLSGQKKSGNCLGFEGGGEDKSGPMIWSFLAQTPHSVDNYRLNRSLGRSHDRQVRHFSKSCRSGSNPTAAHKVSAVRFGSANAALRMVVNDRFKPGIKLMTFN